MFKNFFNKFKKPVPEPSETVTNHLEESESEQDVEYNYYEKQVLKFHKCIQSDFFIRVQDIDFNDLNPQYSLTDAMVYAEHCRLVGDSNTTMTSMAFGWKNFINKKCRAEIINLFIDDITDLKSKYLFNNIQYRHGNIETISTIFKHYNIIYAPNCNSITNTKNIS